jgi:hypothetical protein
MLGNHSSKVSFIVPDPRLGLTLTSKFRACVVSLGYADVYEVRIASIIRVMKAVRTSKASVHFNKNIQRYIPEGSNLHSRRRENLKPHVTLTSFSSA